MLGALGAAIIHISAATTWMPLTPPPPASQDDAAVAAWIRAYVVAGDDVFATTSTTAAIYLRHQSLSRTGAGYVRASIRFEDFQPDPGTPATRSAIQITEFDCVNLRFRILGVDSFLYNNLQGPNGSSDEQAPIWQYPRVQTVAESLLASTCKLEAALEAQQDAQPAAIPAPNVTWSPPVPAEPR